MAIAWKLAAFTAHQQKVKAAQDQATHSNAEDMLQVEYSK